jgi:hypothetical protein
MGSGDFENARKLVDATCQHKRCIPRDTNSALPAQSLTWFWQCPDDSY